jgi:hypothetical protein
MAIRIAPVLTREQATDAAVRRRTTHHERIYVMHQERMNGPGYWESPKAPLMVKIRAEFARIMSGGA